MNIQFWHAREWDYINDFYVPLKHTFSQHNFLFPHVEWEEAPNSRETLKQQDVFLCEVSYWSIWLWIEIWFASIYGTRIICMYKSWSSVSGSLKYVTDEIIEYKDNLDMLNKLKDIL